MNDQQTIRPDHKREECYYLNFNEFEAKLFGHPIGCSFFAFDLNRSESIRFHNKDTQKIHNEIQVISLTNMGIASHLNGRQIT